MKPTFDHTRPLSWSAISSFEYSREQWYDKYVLSKKEEPSVEMLFGKTFAQSIEDGTCDYPGLLDAMQTKKEHAFNVVFNKIPLVGYADGFCDKTFRYLDEVKTGKKPWTQKRADEHGQITMYVLMNMITNKIPPEKVTCRLFWCPTQDNGDFSISFKRNPVLHIFETKRTMQDVLAFGARINRVYKEMEEYCFDHE